MSDPIIDKVFNLLDEWRHLPKYQLERRAPTYTLLLFLPDVCSKALNTTSRLEPIIPEFPMKKDSR